MSTVLIVDDEQEMVETVRVRLEGAGYDTLFAYEGVRAIEMAHKKRPDLILLDLKMPAGTGQSVLQALRSKPDTKNIPVIVVTVLQQTGLREQILAQGAQDFVQKPYEPGLLLQKIQMILGT